ncbi:MAG: hypothetical protein Q8O51_01785 [bacterium]|nr:hypothetical protein [bacterium]
MAKKGLDLLYPIGIRGEENGEAVRAACWTTARRKLARYQRRWGSNYYLMQGVPYAANAHKYLEVAVDSPVHAASAVAMKKQAEHLRRYNVG